MRETCRDLLGLLAPLAPHFAEELHEAIGNKISIFNTAYPQYDKAALIKDSYELAVQVNSKMRGKIDVPNGADSDSITQLALTNELVLAAIEGKTIVKTIIIPNRLVNIVVK